MLGGVQLATAAPRVLAGRNLLRFVQSLVYVQPSSPRTVRNSRFAFPPSSDRLVVYLFRWFSNLQSDSSRVSQ